MPDRGGTSGDGLADRLQSRGDEIRRAYGRRLHEIESALVVDQAIRLKALEQVDGAISDVSRSLRNGNAVPGRGIHTLGRDFVLTGVVRNIHPSELVRAAGALFDIVLQNVLECAACGPESAGLIVLAAMSLQDSILSRLGKASSDYARALLQEIHEAQIGERRRIARELHDRVGQGISVADRQLELYQRYRDVDAVRAARKVDAAHEAVRDTIESVRRATADLRLEMRAESLGTALRRYVESIDAADVRAEVTVTGDETWISPETCDAIFLIVREALRNAFEHSSASAIVAQLEIVPHGCYAMVQDDGVGFEIDEGDGRGVGIATMRERVTLLGGTMGVFSRPAQGTSIRILVPLPGSRHGDGR